MSFDNRPIGIFDSGVGGLTVFKELRRLLPNENLIYFGDTARVPYGGKSAQVITRFSSEILDFLKLQNVKMVVVACNTASALALNKLKAQTELPVIGVIEPGVRAAIKAAQNNIVGVIGTKGTISSQAYQGRLERYKPSIRVLARACPLLVPIVEENLHNSDIARLTVDKYLNTFKGTGLDTLILACTHYPLLKPLINEFFEGKVTLVDSATETAKEVKEVLVARRLVAETEKEGTERFYVSDSPEVFSEIAVSFLDRPLKGPCSSHSWSDCISSDDFF
jgi:glutamate racemase